MFILEVGVADRETRCPVCRSPNVVCRGAEERHFRHVPLGKKTVLIEVDVPRVYCPTCRVVRQVHLRFADARRSYSRGFERYALDLLRHMTIKDVAEWLGVGWDMVKDIQKRYLHRRYAKPKLSNLALIAIDEIAFGKGQRFLSIVLDLVRGRIVFVGEGRDREALEPFFRRLRQSHAIIDAVATDMWGPYIEVVHAHLPKATLVFDAFHVVKLMNEKLSEIRRELQRELKGTVEGDVLKDLRWILLRNREKLKNRPAERKRLERALKVNKPLALGYYLKEELRLFWKQGTKANAETYLDAWLARARATGIPILKRFAKTLDKRREGLLAWYDYPISTGPLEGVNTKIKLVKRMAYGYRDREFFKLRMLGLHETRVELVG